jgi:hypothetical protein
MSARPALCGGYQVTGIPTAINTEPMHTQAHRHGARSAGPGQDRGPGYGRDAAVLDGSIASLGSQYVLGLRTIDCRTGDVLDEEQVQAARKEDVLNALSRLARLVDHMADLAVIA